MPSMSGPCAVLPARFRPVLLALLFIGVAASVALSPARAQQEGSGIDGPDSEIAEPTTLSQQELARVIRILQNDTERKALLRDLKALAAGEELSESSSAPTKPSDWGWRTIGSWFGSWTKDLQQTIKSTQGRIQLLQRFLMTLVLVLLARWGLRLLSRKLAQTRISSRTTIGLIKILAFILIFLVLLLIWGVDLEALVDSPTTKRITRSTLVILLVIALGSALWEVFNSYLRKQAERLDSTAMSERRLQTLLPLIRNMVRIVIIVICLLIILSEIGINIAPLLAGAGIVGLAVGFGAQTLVKDLINGFLVLAENAINVGDWVILGGHDGQVEGLNVRNVRIRDIYGNVNIVPWSSVETVVNQTMDYGWAVVEPGVAYRENIDEVIDVVKEVAAEMRRDPQLNQDILSDLQILGLIELGDSAVVVRTRFKTTPFRRWFLERDFRRRLKNRFDELGIEIPYPHSTVYFGEDKQGLASPARIEVMQRGDAAQMSGESEPGET